VLDVELVVLDVVLVVETVLVVTLEVVVVAVVVVITVIEIVVFSVVAKQASEMLSLNIYQFVFSVVDCIITYCDVQFTYQSNLFLSLENANDYSFVELDIKYIYSLVFVKADLFTRTPNGMIMDIAATMINEPVMSIAALI
jgi:hypothetical protein